MKNRLLLLVLASAAAISGCVTTAGYRGHSGGYYGGASGDYRYSRSTPYGYYDSDRYYYGYDRYGYDRYGYGYDRYGRSYGYPYGYAPYYNNRYYYYYPAPQRPPTTTHTPPPQLDPNRPHRDLSHLRRPRSPMPPMDDTRDLGLSRDLSHYRNTPQPAPPYEYRDHPESVQPMMDSPRRMRPVRQEMITPMPSAPAPASVRAESATDAASVLENVR